MPNAGRNPLLCCLKGGLKQSLPSSSLDGDPFPFIYSQSLHNLPTARTHVGFYWHLPDIFMRPCEDTLLFWKAWLGGTSAAMSLFC